jgi:hypothetical protein
VGKVVFGKLHPVVVVVVDFMAAAAAVTMDVVPEQMAAVVVEPALHWFLPVELVLQLVMQLMAM